MLKQLSIFCDFSVIVCKISSLTCRFVYLTIRLLFWINESRWFEVQITCTCSSTFTWTLENAVRGLRPMYQFSVLLYESAGDLPSSFTLTCPETSLSATTPRFWPAGSTSEEKKDQRDVRTSSPSFSARRSAIYSTESVRSNESLWRIGSINRVITRNYSQTAFLVQGLIWNFFLKEFH